MVNLLVFLEKKNIQVHLWMHGEQNLIKETLLLYVILNSKYNFISYSFLYNRYSFILHYMQIDISSAIGYILSIKSENEITLIKKASLSSVDMFTKYLKEQIMEIIDADKVITSIINSLNFRFVLINMFKCLES